MFKKIPQMVAKAEVVSHIGKIENVVGRGIRSRFHMILNSHMNNMKG